MVGDLIAKPMKTTSEIALRRVTVAYHYLAQDPAGQQIVQV